MKDKTSGQFPPGKKKGTLFFCPRGGIGGDRMGERQREREKQRGEGEKEREAKCLLVS